MCPSKEVRIDPFLHGRDKFKLPSNYYRKIEKDLIAASKTMREGVEKARISRIDVIGQNGNDGYE